MTTDEPATPTALLRQEHELILQVVEALAAMVSAGGTGQNLDHQNVARCITFLRLFADACHHAKEEDLLFPSLAAQGLPADAGPVAVMLNEHEQGRALVGEMAAALPGATDGEQRAVEDLRSAARGYVELMTAHIAKENHILFDMADRLIDGAACRELCAAYDGVSEQRFEGHSKSDLVDLARQIVAR